MNYPVIVHDPPTDTFREHVIRERAYEVYLQRGRSDGQALDDWLEAERDVLVGTRKAMGASRFQNWFEGGNLA
jgi:Protein of unknown function (DUF2934)